MADDYSRVDFDGTEPTPSEHSGTPRVSLTDALGLEEMRANVWYLSTGDAMSRHTEPVQEELYLVLSGPGQMRIDDEELEIPEGEAVRVPPETERQVYNDTDREHVWAIVGAPPG